MRLVRIQHTFSYEWLRLPRFEWYDHPHIGDLALTDNRKNIDTMIDEALDRARRQPRPITARALAELGQCASAAELRKLAEGCDQ